MLVLDAIEFHARTRPHSPMLIQGERCLSFSRAVQQSRRMAAALQKRGITRGDRLAIVGENSMEHILLLLAAGYLGAVAVPLNYRLAVAELVDIIDDAQAQLVVIGDPTMAELKATLKHLLPADVRLLERLEEADEKDLIQAECQENAVLLQLYTSGTTGRAKGVQISHKNIRALAVSSWRMYLSKPGFGTTDLVVAPLFHIGGLGSVLIPLLAGGAVLLHARFEPENTVADIERLGINTLFLVPAMIQALLTTVADIRQRNFSSLKQMCYGASPISPSLLEQAIEVFDCHFYQLFGMTETTGTVVSLSPEDHPCGQKTHPVFDFNMLAFSTFLPCPNGSVQLTE